MFKDIGMEFYTFNSDPITDLEQSAWAKLRGVNYTVNLRTSLKL